MQESVAVCFPGILIPYNRGLHLNERTFQSETNPFIPKSNLGITCR